MPEIVCVDGETVGKCPAGRPDSWRQRLLDAAIGHVTTEPYSARFSKRLYAVDADGTIYTAQTSNPGDSYHGYPYAGPLGKRLIAALRAQAVSRRCERQFEAWFKRYIVQAGRPDI